MSSYIDTGPAVGVVSVTPSDSAMMGEICRALWVGGARPRYASFAGKTPTEAGVARQITRQHSISGKMAIGI